MYLSSVKEVRDLLASPGIDFSDADAVVTPGDLLNKGSLNVLAPEYNEKRPHGALNQITLAAYAAGRRPGAEVAA